MTAAIIDAASSFSARPQRFARPAAPAPIIDFQATADCVRAARETGQATRPLIPTQITVRPGDWVFDAESCLCGRLSHFIHGPYGTKAVINASGVAIAAKLPDLHAVVPPRDPIDHRPGGWFARPLTN